MTWHFSDLWGHCIFLNSQLVCDAFLQGEWDWHASLPIGMWKEHLQILSSVPILLFGECLLTLQKSQQTCVLCPFIPGDFICSGVADHLQLQLLSCIFVQLLEGDFNNQYFKTFEFFFLLAKGYLLKLQLLIQTQTSKKYVLAREWKNLDSFRIPTDKRDFRPWSLESKIMEPSTWLPPFFLQLFHLTEGRWKWLPSPCWILFRRMLAWKSQHYRMICDWSANRISPWPCLVIFRTFVL